MANEGFLILSQGYFFGYVSSQLTATINKLKP
jgi:hypothetical protein